VDKWASLRRSISVIWSQYPPNVVRCSLTNYTTISFVYSLFAASFIVQHDQVVFISPISLSLLDTYISHLTHFIFIMPYSGPPSKACEKCRQRRIRCDQNQDGCSQCATIRQDCPGYRNHLDLLFRNQTDTIAETVKREKAKIRPKRKGNHNVKTNHLSVDFPAAAEASTLPGKQKPSESVTRALQTPVNSLPLSLGDLGVCYFMDRFVLGMVGSVQQHMHPFASIAYKSDPQLLACMQAVGLAVLSNIETSVYLMTSAHRYYGVALRLTNSALHFSADAIKDSTVLAIMTLNLWENVTGNTRQSLKAWRNHVQGISEVYTFYYYASICYKRRYD